VQDESISHGDLSVAPASKGSVVEEAENMFIYIVAIVDVDTRSRDSSVGIATCYVLDGRVAIPGRGTILLYSIASRPALGPTQPPIHWVPGALSPGVKQQGRESEH
jgi:hypothetical protein